MGKRKAEVGSTNEEENKSKKGKKPSAKGSEPKRVDEQGRSVRYRTAPTNAVRDRMARALPGSGHRMFLLDRKTVVACSTSPSGPVEEFAVLGATGNVYTVTIGCHPQCTCPDYARHPEARPCKHIAYVLIRVLRLPINQPEVWQKVLLPAEAEMVLSGQLSERAEENVLADRSVRDAYRKAVQPTDLSSPESIQRHVEGDCPICYDEMHSEATAKEEEVVFCTSCGNNVHVECFRRWVTSKRQHGAEVTCVWCRAPWSSTNQGEAIRSGSQAYLNLSSVSRVHQAGNTLEELYGDNAQWIRRRSSGAN
eukprot:jgi/Botrbrau1/7736/Bobra.0159s0166.1